MSARTTPLMSSEATVGARIRSLETTIRTKTLKCFVHTFCPLYPFGRWQTEVVECEPTTGVRLQRLARFRHHRHSGAALALAIHESFCREIRQAGLRGTDLRSSFMVVHSTFSQHRLVDDDRTIAERPKEVNAIATVRNDAVGEDLQPLAMAR
jgi:hypothetical protein